MFHHLVRVGVMGHIGRFAAVDPVRYPRGAAVICRTNRGLEVGEVLATLEHGTLGSDGALLRRVTAEDELLLERIQRRKNDALKACAEMLDERGIGAALMDVEHLFDGTSIYFYFLGEISTELEQLTADLAEAYEAEVQFRRFSETLASGCGPGCGTEEGPGCGSQSGGCAGCSLASACQPRN